MGTCSQNDQLPTPTMSDAPEAAKATTQVRLALKRGLKKGTLKQAKATGKGAGCFKLVKVEKPKKVKKAKKPAKKVAKKKPAKKAAKKAAKKPKKAAKNPAAKKPAAKKPA